MEGNIVVDGVLTSWYASFDHDLAHLVMSPVQWFPEMMQVIFGEDNESTAYINIMKVLGRWMLPQKLMDN